MLSNLRNLGRNLFLSMGLDVRLASRVVGLDPIRDIKKLNQGKACRTVIDIGANVGQSALRYRQAFPEASIHSIEPTSTSYRAGKENTAAHPSITWHHLAMGNTDQPIVFYSSGTSQQTSVMHHRLEGGERNEVEMMRFDDFYAANGLAHIDLLKTDTEGLDLAVLEGAANTLAGQHISYILCEVGFSKADTNHTLLHPVSDYLEQYGYRLVGFYGLTGIDAFQKSGVTYADALFALPANG